MSNSRLRLALAVVLGATLVLSACSPKTDTGNGNGPGSNWGSTPSDPTTGSPDSPGQTVTQLAPPVVDERVELVFLAARLSGHEWYDIEETDYHRSLNSTFADFRGHPAAEYAKWLVESKIFSNFFRFALFIKEDMSGLVDDISNLTDGVFGSGLTEERAREFYSHLKGLYDESNFAEFFASNAAYYQGLLDPYMEDELFQGTDLDWFVQFAEADDSPTQFRYLITPSVEAVTMSATISDQNTTYALLGAWQNISSEEQYQSLLHEFCHGFSYKTPYIFNLDSSGYPRFIEIVKDTTPPGYEDSHEIAQEYIVRSLVIMYYAEHDQGREVERQLWHERMAGFDHIEEMYGIVSKYIRDVMGGKLIRDILIDEREEVYGVGNAAEPPDPELLQVGRDLYDKGDYEAMRKHFNNALKEHPFTAEYYAQLATAHFMLSQRAAAGSPARLREFDSAMVNIDRAIRLAPDDTYNTELKEEMVRVHEGAGSGN
jgi:tetratricopeptide (TPR) repeat protein